MKKFFNLLQWAIVIALLIFAVRTLTRPVPPPHYRPDTWSSWNGFYALSFAGVSREKGTDYVTPHQLGAFLKMLREDGYESIRPEDALAFLEGRAPLPAKAVLLLFEGGRKDSFLAATPLLREFGQLATMCIPTSVTRRWGSFYLHDNDLEKFLKDPHWNLASMGHEAILDIPVASNRQGRFLSQRLWTQGRLEDERAFRSRLASDFAAAAQILERIGHTNVISYLFPYADAGTSAGSDPLAAEIIEDSVSAHHRLAVARADDAFNGPDTDPFQVSRLRVRSSWSADDLRRELQNARPRVDGVSRVGGPDQWSLDGASADADTLRVESGGTAWLQGSSAWADQDVEARVRRSPGSTAILYARFGGPSRTLRVTLSDDELALQERYGFRMQTLAAFPSGGNRTNEYALKLRVRGNRVWLYNHGRLLAGPVPLTPSTTHGRIGFECSGGRLDVTGFSATPSPGTWVQAGAYRTLPAAARDELSTLLLPWFRTDRDDAVSAEQVSELLAAAAQGVEVVPLVDIAAPLAAEQAQAQADRLARSLEPLITKALVRRLALRGDSEELAEALRERGYQLVRTVSPAQALERAGRGRTALAFDIWMLQGRGEEAERAVDLLLRQLPASHLVLLTDDPPVAPPGVRVIRQMP